MLAKWKMSVLAIENEGFSVMDDGDHGGFIG